MEIASAQFTVVEELAAEVSSRQMPSHRVGRTRIPGSQFDEVRLYEYVMGEDDAWYSLIFGVVGVTFRSGSCEVEDTTWVELPDDRRHPPLDALRSDLPPDVAQWVAEEVAGLDPEELCWTLEEQGVCLEEIATVAVREAVREAVAE